MNVSLDLYSCLGNRSGVGTYTYELARRMTDGDGLTFQGNFFSFLGKHDAEIRALELDYSCRSCRMLPHAAFRLAQIASLIPYDLAFGSADVRVFFNFIVPSGCSGKSIATVYDMTYLRFPETMKRRNLLRLKTQMDASVSRCRRILTISEFSRQEISELLGFPKERISVVPCAVPGAPQAADFPAAAARFGITKPYLLFVGTIEPRKNLERLLLAFERLKNEAAIPHQLVLAGGAGWRNDAIHRLAETMKHREDVVFTGFVTDAEKNALYRNADLFVFPSLYEGFGLPPLEAMQQGCPVVCTDAASLPEVVGNAAVLADPYSASSIAEGIFRVLSDDGLRAALVQKGLARAAEFSWDAAANTLKHIIKEVIDEP